MRGELSRNLVYALPAIPLAALYLPLFSYVTPFYASERGVDIAALGAAWIVIRLFDAVSDPAIGWLSDRTPGRLGRRRVWLAASVPLVCLATWQAFVPPEGAGLSHAVLWLFLLTLGWTMAQTPYTAWGAELAKDYAARARVTGWREGFVLVGTVVATLLYVLGGEGGAGLEAVALAVVVLLPLLVALAVWRTPDPGPEHKGHLSVLEGWRAIRANRPFARLLGAWFVNGAANGLPVTLFLFFVEHRLGAPEATGWLLMLYFAAAIGGIPVWTWAAGRFSKHRTWSVAMLYACAIFAAALFLGEGDVAAFAVITVLTGLALGADLALPPAMQADVVELDTIRTGAARAGLFFAIWQVATKAAVALSSGLALILLGQAGFSAGTPNDATALWALAGLYAGAPILLKLGAVALMWSFPLDQAALRAARVAGDSDPDRPASAAGGPAVA
jgi:Na+/melibiose symporter-like transporter